jgi:hypothetical protein
MDPRDVPSLARALPIPPPSHVTDAAAWGSRFNTFRELKQRRICKNKTSSLDWRRSLPTDVDFLGNIVEVFDGMVAHNWGANAAGVLLSRDATLALNNMFGVDVQGIITTAGVGWPGSLSDSTMIHENPIWVAMEELDNANVSSQDRATDCLTHHAAGFSLRFFCLTPYQQADTTWFKLPASRCL